LLRRSQSSLRTKRTSSLILRLAVASFDPSIFVFLLVFKVLTYNGQINQQLIFVTYISLAKLKSFLLDKTLTQESSFTSGMALESIESNVMEQSFKHKTLVSQA